MAERSRNSVVHVPAKVVIECKGFSLDIGGSVIKVVYRTKDDYEIAKTKKAQELSDIHMISFARAEMDEAIAFIKENVYFTKGADETLSRVFTTGVGCSQYREIIKEQLNCSIENLTEFDCFVYSFQYLASTMTRAQLLHPVDQKVVHQVKQEYSNCLALNSDLSNATHIYNHTIANELANETDSGEIVSRSEPLAKAENIYPCLLGMLGSAFGWIKVQEDGKFEMIDGSNRGGRTFYGLGCLLSGCKTFEELATLAAEGDKSKVDFGTNDLVSAADDNGDLYSYFGKDTTNRVVHCFGKGIGRVAEDFSKADLAAALLQMSALDLVQTISLTAANVGCKNIFFVGSFPSDQNIRNVITRQFTRTNLRENSKGQEVIQFDFVKPGSHLGALGALINTVDEFLKVPSEVMTKLKVGEQ